VERHIRIHNDGIRAVLNDTALPHSLCTQALAYITYTRNHVPSSAMPNSTPAKLFLSEGQPKNNPICFGKQVYTLIMPEDRLPGTKLDPSATAG
jgi:hypothetical protein